MEDKKQVWSTADVIKNRNNWTLASDVELLHHIQSLSEKLVNKSRSTLQLLNSFEDDVNSTCTSVANVNNRFAALSDTQFIENKVRDDSPETEEPPVGSLQKEPENSETITEKLNEALSNGIQVLRTQYDIIAVTDSESEDEEPPEVLLKARNPFMSRRLPYIIGSEEFNKHDHLGLVTSSEDEDEENVSEDDEEDDEDDDLGYLRKVPPQLEPAKIEIRNRPQVIRVSSDSEDSDISDSGSEKLDEKVTKNYAQSRPAQATPKTTYTFAEHLNATLHNMGGNVVTPLVDDAFSPPPLPTNEDDQSSDDEKSDSGSDIFAPRKKVIESSAKPKVVSDLFDDDEVSRNIESSRVSRKSSTATDISQSSGDLSALKSTHTATNNVPPKPRADVPTSKMFSAVNAELSNRFNKKVAAKDESAPSDENDSAISKSSSSSGAHKKPVTLRKPEKPSEARNESTSSRKASIPAVRTSNSHSEDIFESTSSKPATKRSSHIDDIFGNAAATPTTSKPSVANVKPKVVSLFDDDDSMDDLFGSNSKNRKATNSGSRAAVLVDDADDLFSPRKKPEKSTAKSTISSVTHVLNKKIDLFDDDSDSGDDIFAIINSQKKSTLSAKKPNIERNEDSLRKTAFVASKEDLFASTEPKVSQESCTKSDLFESRNTFKDRSSMENKVKNTNLFDSDNEDDDIFSIPFKSTKESPSAGRKTSGSDIFENVISKKESPSAPKNESTVSIPDTPPRSTFLENKSGFTAPTIENVIPKKDTLFHSEDESKNRDRSTEVMNKPSIVPRPKVSGFAASTIENDIPKKHTLFDPDESTNRDRFMEVTNKPSTVPRSEVFEDSGETKPPTVASSAKSDNSNEKSKLTEKTDSFNGERKSDVTESARSVNALSRQFEETSTSQIPAHNSSSDKIDGNQTSLAKPPVKLALGRGLNINVNALLPGSGWTSISKQVKENGAETDKKESLAPTIPNGRQTIDVAERPKSVDEAPNLLITIAKERSKIAVRRRPPSRRARVNNALQSDVFTSNSTIDNTDDEPPDSAYKTASESNSPESITSVKKTEVKNVEKTDDFFSSLEGTQFIPPASATTTYQKERGKLAKARKRPPSMAKEKKMNNLSGDEIDNKNKTANDLGNILITASSSREPPAMIGGDFKSILSDSDKDDDPLDDIMTDAKTINEPIPQIDAVGGLSFSSSVLSSPVAAPRTTASTLFESLEDDVTEDLFGKPKSSSVPPSSASDSSQSTAAAISSNVIDRPTERGKPEILKDDALSHSTEFKDDVRTNVSLKVEKKPTSDLFSFIEDDSDDDFDALFSKVVSPKVSATKTSGSPVVTPASDEPVLRSKTESSASNSSSMEIAAHEPLVSKKSDLFLESDLLLNVEKSVKSHATPAKAGSFSTRPKEVAKKSSKTSKVSTNLFADDDDDDDNELFTSSKKSLVKTKVSSSMNLFADDDDDDDSLFGSAVPVHRGDKSKEKLKSSSLTTSSEKARIVKLRSQTVETDPLTGEIINKAQVVVDCYEKSVANCEPDFPNHTHLFSIHQRIPNTMVLQHVQ